MSYQKDFCRSEDQIVVGGHGTVNLDARPRCNAKREPIYIPVEAAHRISKNGKEPLTFIEAQQGDYFGEGDFLRLENDYGRILAEGNGG